MKKVKTSEELKRDLRKLEDSRHRLLKAFLALRAIKTLGNDVEPALMALRKSLRSTPAKLPARLRRLRAAVEREVKRLLQDLDENVSKAQGEPHTAALARYMEADRDLKPGDLELPK